MITRKIGTNKGRPRLWIEGEVLSGCGWVRGTRWSVEQLGCGGFAIVRDTEGKRKVAGTETRPIIDILGRVLETAFPVSDLLSGRIVSLSVAADRITVKLIHD